MTQAADQTLDQILAGYLKAVDAGQTPSPQELLAQYPQHRAELSDFFADQDNLQRWTASLRAVQTGTVNASEEATLPPPPSAASGDVTSADVRAGDATGGATTDGQSLPPGKFGDYELLEELARGGMGVVYKARQISLNRIVALKMILSGRFASADDVRRFRAEAEAAALLHHANIVPIHEVDECLGQHFFTMQLIDGGSLSARLAEFRLPALDGLGEDETNRRWSATEIKQRKRKIAGLMATVARAVHHAHQHGILHRDLKPGNILVDSQGTPHVTDFGLAKQLSGEGRSATETGAGEEGETGAKASSPAQITQSGAIVGTPSYMAPEQAAASKSLTTAADTYSLGAIFFELLTGRPPFRAETPMETLLQVLSCETSRPSTLNPGVDQDLETICMKCLEREPQRRYASTEALAEDLDRWAAGEPIQARRAGRLERLSKWASRRPAAAGLLGVSLASVLVLLVLGGFLWHNLAERAQAVESKEQAEKLRDQAEAGRKDAVQKTSQAQTLADKIKSDVETLRNLATVETTKALAARQEAQDQEIKAKLAEKRGQHLIYAADMQLARAAWANDDVPRMVDLLTPYREKTELTGLRGFEWNYLWSLPHSSRLSWKPYPQKKSALAPEPGDFARVLMAVSPDGKTIATCGTDTIKLWDLSSGKLKKTLSGPRDAASLVYSDDGKRLILAVANSDPKFQAQLVKLMQDTFSPKGKPDPKDERMTSVFEHHEVDLARGTSTKLPFDPHRLNALSVLGSEGKGSSLLGGIITLTGKRVMIQMCSAVSPDRKTLAIGGVVTEWVDPTTILQYSALILWDIEAGRHKLLHKVDKGFLMSLAFSPDGRTLALAGMDKNITLWDMERSRELSPLRGHTTFVGTVVFPKLSVNGAEKTPSWFVHGNVKVKENDLLLSAGADIKLWNIATGEAIATFKGHQNLVSGLAMTADGKTIVSMSGDGFLKVWDPSTIPGPTAPALKGQVLAAAFSRAEPNLDQVLTFDSQGQLRICDALSGKQLKHHDLKSAVVRPIMTRSNVHFSADGRFLAVTGIFADAPTASSVKIFATATGEQRHFVKNIPQPMPELAISSDGSKLVVAGGDFGKNHELKVWDLKAGKDRQISPDIGGAISELALSADGQTAALAIRSPSKFVFLDLQLWDLGTGKKTFSLKGDLKGAKYLTFSSDGKRLAAAFRNQVVCWDTASGKEVLAITAQMDSVRALAFTPDGSRLITGESSEMGRGSCINFWDLATGRLIVTIDQSASSVVTNLTLSHSGAHLVGVFAPEGLLFLSAASKDSEVKIWHGGNAG